MWICKTVISPIIQHEDTKRIDWDKLKNFFYYAPGGTSVKNLHHWLQVIEQPSTKWYDYGTEKNLNIYKSESPPEYNFDLLKNMSADIFITITDKDPFCPVEDFNYMITLFKSSKKTIKRLDNYNHVDYMWGQTAHKDIYYDILDFLNDDYE
jgi:hypothetical protein